MGRPRVWPDFEPGDIVSGKLVMARSRECELFRIVAISDHGEIVLVGLGIVASQMHAGRRLTVPLTVVDQPQLERKYVPVSRLSERRRGSILTGRLH